MKKIFVAILLLSLSSVLAQELILPCAVNKNEKQIYYYTFTGDKFADQSERIAKSVDSIFAKQGLLIEQAKFGVDFSDVVFKITSPNEVNVNGETIKFKNANDAAKKITMVLKKMFYSGSRPQYSTVFEGGRDGYVEYRIPSVVATKSGRIVAFIEGRKAHKDQAMNDILSKYSDDGGKTWSGAIEIAKDGQASLNNPCAIYIAQTDCILFMYQYFPPNSTEGSTLAGVDGDDVVRNFIVSSDDGGVSWSAPHDITVQTKHIEATSVACGPGVALQVSSGDDKGRIIVPFNGNGAGRWFNYLVYSDDLGENWSIANGESGYGTNESQIVQIANNKFLINARSHRYPQDTSYTAPEGWNPWNCAKYTRNRAHIYVTMEGEKTTWDSTRVQLNQPDPTCQGSIIRVGQFGDGMRSRLLLANSASQHTFPIAGRPYSQTAPARINGTVRISYDEGRSWTYSKRIYGDRFTEYQYSVLVDLGNGKIGCIFEAHPEVRFAVFDISWLTGGTDK